MTRQTEGARPVEGEGGGEEWGTVSNDAGPPPSDSGRPRQAARGRWAPNGGGSFHRRTFQLPTDTPYPLAFLIDVACPTPPLPLLGAGLLASSCPCPCWLLFIWVPVREDGGQEWGAMMNGGGEEEGRADQERQERGEAMTMATGSSSPTEQVDGSSRLLRQGDAFTGAGDGATRGRAGSYLYKEVKIQFTSY